MLMRDGGDGTKGAIAVVRSGNQADALCLTFKATSHGLSHGHYDKLSITLHDNGNPILTDYGAARFLNIEPKFGGHYTKENYTWAMQTIAHNTLTLNQTSHFNAQIDISSKYNPEIQYCDFSNSKAQIVCALDSNAYPDVVMRRTTSMLKIDSLEFPFIVDVFKINSQKNNQTVDLPFYYSGHVVSTDFDFVKNTSVLKPLGTENGFQHLWIEASGKTNNSQARFTWFKGSRFYSITTITDKNSELILTRLGANDPNFNLRNETTAFMIRQQNKKNHTFVSIIEPHGLYDINKEVTYGVHSNIASLQIVEDNDLVTAIEIKTKDNKIILYAINNKSQLKVNNKFNYNNKTYEFSGVYYFNQIK